MLELIGQAESLTDEDEQLLSGWGENIFGLGTFNLSWRSKDLHFLLYSGGEWTAPH
jgi:hypothetical protein